MLESKVLTKEKQLELIREKIENIFKNVSRTKGDNGYSEEQSRLIIGMYATINF